MKKRRIAEICIYGILGAFLFVAKFAMSSLPNIEPVSLLIIAYTITFGIKAICPISIYVLLELFIYGLGFWSIAYLYIWFILMFMVLIMHRVANKSINPLYWALISGAFGLIFGALYIPLYIVSGGFAFAATWWVQGVPYDIVHCVANFVLCIILFKPITSTLLKLKNKL